MLDQVLRVGLHDVRCNHSLVQTAGQTFLLSSKY